MEIAQADAARGLSMRGISKSFQGKFANRDVSLDLGPGEIVGLLGENGAGKSTLMNVLFGLYQADSGSVSVDGLTLRLKSPKDAIAAGIGMVHQHFMLVQSQSVAENVALALGDCPFFRPLDAVRRRVAVFNDRYGLEVDTEAFVYDLSAGELQRVEIVKALLNGAKYLILDEPTSVLSPQEAEELFSVLRAMAAEGTGIILISHKLDEIISLCNRVVVLRKGEISGAREVAGADKAELARMMVGRDINFSSERKKQAPGDAILSVKGLSVRGDRGELSVRGLNLEVRQGEIFGVAGVSGNGQRELAEAITGLRRAEGGQVLLDGEDVTNASVRTLSAKGIAHVPEERMRFGIVPNLFLYENAVLKEYGHDRFSTDLFIKYPAVKNFAEFIVKNFQVTAPSIRSQTKNLSGGNIQKLILGREIQGDPSILVAAHPTYGLDVGATEYIRERLLERRADGGAILLISEDLEEIFALSDRIGVMCKGEFVGVVDRDETDVTEVGLMMGGVVPQRLGGEAK
jgi:general nucleoside transport system ATP-binding protein